MITLDISSRGEKTCSNFALALLLALIIRLSALVRICSSLDDVATAIAHVRGSSLNRTSLVSLLRSPQAHSANPHTMVPALTMLQLTADYARLQLTWLGTMDLQVNLVFGLTFGVTTSFSQSLHLFVQTSIPLLLQRWFTTVIVPICVRQQYKLMWLATGNSYIIDIRNTSLRINPGNIPSPDLLHLLATSSSPCMYVILRTRPVQPPRCLSQSVYLCTHIRFTSHALPGFALAHSFGSVSTNE